VLRLDFNLLVALDALLQEESVSRGGQKIGLSQPAMSHALSKLRGLFADPLLVRIGGRMQLTLRAQSMRRPVKDALERVYEVFISDSFVPASSTRTFRLFMSDYASNLLLPSLLKKVRRSAPSVRLEVHPWKGIHADSNDNERIPDAVVACQTHDLPGFYRQRLFTDRDVCVMRSGHDLCRKKLSLSTFLDAPQVAVAAVEFRQIPLIAGFRNWGTRVLWSQPFHTTSMHSIS
jgi:DNA-binding transcriptional LysR family regulator